MAELETLQAQLDAGEITETEFGDAISEIIGDRGAGMPFAGLSFYGSPSGHRMNAGAAAVLDLTEEQQVAAEEIFQSLHDDIDALRAATHEAIRAMLTDEQLLILDDMGALDQEVGDTADGSRRRWALAVVCRGQFRSPTNCSSRRSSRPPLTDSAPNFATRSGFATRQATPSSLRC